MTRALAITLFAIAVVLGVAGVVYRVAFGASTVAPPIVTTLPVGPTTPTTAAGPTTSTAPTTSATTAVAPEAVAVAPTAVVSAHRGSVQVKSGDTGAWRDVDDGVVLAADDAIRAGRGGEATLALGGGVEVRLSPRTELRVRELSAALARVRLEEGHVSATVDGGMRSLRVQARGSDAEAESRGGTFGVVTDGNGQLAVAATTGRVKVSAAGKSVDVGAGETTSVRAGGAPAAPATVPSSLFLKLAAVAATQTNRTTTTVNGTTAPRALVRVGDQVATSDDGGRFSLKVPLKDGSNDLAVEVIDASGRRSDGRLPQIVVDRQKPKIDAAVKWGAPNPGAP